MSTSKIINNLGLNYSQTKLLFNIQYDLVYWDILNESDLFKKYMKLKWLNEWSKEIQQTLEYINGEKDELIGIKTLYESDIDKDKFISKQNLTNNMIIIVRHDCCTNKLPLYLIYMEAELFEPYFEFHNKKMNYILDNFKTKFKKDAKLRYNKHTNRSNKLKNYARLMDIINVTNVDFRKLYSKIINRITNKNLKILGGITIGVVIVAITSGYAAPSIGALVAPSGLYGASAISAGLAVLGGGAVASGGLGMAGGIAVVVGGGALLGSVAGGGAGLAISLIKSSSEFTLIQSVKLEIVIKEIILNSQKDVRMAQELIKEQIEVIKKLEDELYKLKIIGNKNKEAIKNLEQSIKYMKKVLEECIRNL